MNRQSVQDLIKGLEPPQSHRLRGFCRTMNSARTKQVFDDKMKDELLSIMGTETSKKDLREVIEYLDEMEYAASYYDPAQLGKQVSSFSDANHKYSGFNQHYKKAKADLMEVFSKARLYPVIYKTFKMFEKTLPQTDTHAGFTYIESGLRTKGENIEHLFANWREITERAISEGSFNRVILPGSRTQASGAFSHEGEKTGKFKSKTRLINMVDLRVIMAESVFSRPIQKWMGQTIEWYGGGKDMPEIDRIIFNGRSRFQHSLTVDYSGFDQSISNWLIYDAFDIIKQAFILNESERQLFDVIVNDFINKCFIGLDGELVFSNKGVPSGSMFTQIVDSIVNMLMISTYMNSQKIDRWSSCIMGDDNVIFTPQALDLKDLKGYLEYMFGIKMNPDKCSQTTRNGNSVDFLSREWRVDGQWRHPHILISKLLYPERFRDYDRKGYTPKHVLYSYWMTYRLGMEQFLDPIFLGYRYFGEFTQLRNPSLNKSFLTGYQRYLAQEKMRESNDSFILRRA